jgi:hypothetical protein
VLAFQDLDVHVNLHRTPLLPDAMKKKLAMLGLRVAHRRPIEGAARAPWLVLTENAAQLWHERQKGAAPGHHGC